MPVDLEPIKQRLAAAAPGPWRWGYLYQCRGTHWCLENDQSAALGSTINYHLVTFGTEEYEYDDDGNVRRLDQTPDFQLIAHAPSDIAALIGEVERLVDILHDRHAHPDYEYETTDGPRGVWDGSPDLSVHGWYCQSWKFYDYHEVRTWRRQKGASDD